MPCDQLINSLADAVWTPFDLLPVLVLGSTRALPLVLTCKAVLAWEQYGADWQREETPFRALAGAPGTAVGSVGGATVGPVGGSGEADVDWLFALTGRAAARGSPTAGARRAGYTRACAAPRPRANLETPPMSTLHYCPQCRSVAAPARRWSWATTATLLLLALAWAIAIGTGWGLLIASLTPAAIVAAVMLRGCVCAACGWRHTRVVTPDEIARAKASVQTVA